MVDCEWLNVYRKFEPNWPMFNFLIGNPVPHWLMTVLLCHLHGNVFYHISIKGWTLLWRVKRVWASGLGWFGLFTTSKTKCRLTVSSSRPGMSLSWHNQKHRCHSVDQYSQAWSYSGAWHTGDPAIIVLVPIKVELLITWVNLKSITVPCIISESIYIDV